MTRVLFVCLGNICRSPLAEGAMRALLARRGLDGAFTVDSAGTIGHHAGEAPDPRSVAEARRRGVDISGQRSRQLMPEDFDRFDWIVAMDARNLADAAELRRSRPSARARLVAMMDHIPVALRRGLDGVPDPYYGGPEGFADVWDLLSAGVEPLLDAMLAEAPRPE
jgi:protein-tyrosine phosphatase